jgi:peroxiredoxin
LQSDKLAPGQKAPAFSLPGVDGRTHILSDHLSAHQAVVVMFICNHCPYVRAYVPRLIALQDQFVGRVQMLGISSNDTNAYPEDSFENMKIVSKQWGLNFPYLWDEDQAVARSFGAQRTPEIFALDAQGICQYEGGVDDNFQDATKVRDQPLRDALQQLIAGQAATRPQTWAIGCTIKWKKS